MGGIVVDQTRFLARHHGEPDARQQALWVFSIQERDICFWGRYPDAVSTAKRYAELHGVAEGTISLVDYTKAVWTPAPN